MKLSELIQGINTKEIKAFLEFVLDLSKEIKTDLEKKALFIDLEILFAQVYRIVMIEWELQLTKESDIDIINYKRKLKREQPFILDFNPRTRRLTRGHIYDE